MPEDIKEKKIWFTGFLEKEKKFFLENLSVLISAGLDLLSALRSLQQEMKSRRLKKILGNIILKVEGGEPFWRALQATTIFPNRVLTLIKFGEESGRLSENLAMVASQLEKERLFGAKIRTAMLYPAIVLPLTLLVGVGTAWFTLPKLVEVFSQVNVPLPIYTRLLLDIGIFFKNYGAFVVPLFLLILINVLYFLFSFPKTKYLGYVLLSRSPLIKELVQQVELARLGYIMSSLIEAGLPVVNSLKSLAEATSFRNYQNFYQFLHDSLQTGNSFAKSFQEYRSARFYLPGFVQSMIISAEKSGKLGEVFGRLGRSYESKVETTVKNFSTIIEPALLIIIGLVIGAIALAVMTPMYNLMQAF
jgi:type IV pilus assembly protein PilC